MFYTRIKALTFFATFRDMNYRQILYHPNTEFNSVIILINIS